MTGINGRAFSEVLKRERKRRGWSQANVAEHVGTDPKSVSRWERGLNMPGPYFIQKLCEVFDTIPEAFGLFDGRQEQTPHELEGVRDQQESSSQVTSAPPSSHAIAPIPPRSNRSISASSFSFPPVMFTFGQTEQALTQRLPGGTITMLFMDIEGSTRLLQQLSERYGEVLGVCRHLLRAVFQHWNGHEVDTQGDSFFVVFARATDAVAAAVAAQRILAAHAWPHRVAMRMRMGLHTGEPSHATEGYVGLDVHHAARIMSAGHGGQVLLSQTTRDLVEHSLPEGVSLRDLGEHRLKDLQHPSHLYQLDIAGLPADFAPLKTLDASPNNLPVQPTPFIGREKQVTAVVRLLSREDVRLLTLTGPGGTGKTRLALQVAAELSEVFADGVFFVNLAPLSDPQFVLSAIAQTLDIQETGQASPLELLQASLREKQLLLVLDNFEQVIQAASQIATLLTGCPKVKLVVTSRTVLHVRAEQEFAVPPLALPDPKHLPDLVTLSQYEAVALFIARAQAVKPDFQITNATAPGVAEICVRLDGLPLAIELAAARIKLFPPPALLARLGKRLTLLTGGARDAPARQQTLRDTIAWSYGLLDMQEQHLSRRLSIFVGGATLGAIDALYTALGDEPGQVLEEVASLIDKSLVQQTEQDGDEPRFRMLETIREYGLEMLAASGELQATQEAHARYYLRLAEEAGPYLNGTETGRWLNLLEQEHDNLRMALTWMVEGMAKGRVKMAVQLCEALSGFWRARGHLNEGRTFVERILSADGGMETSLRAKALLIAGDLANLQGDDYQAEVYAQAALAIFREIGDSTGSADALLLLSFEAQIRGDITAALVLSEEVIALIGKTGEKRQLTSALFHSASALCLQGKYTRGFALWDECLALSKKGGSKLGLVWVLLESAFNLALCQSDAATIRTRLDEALPLIREVGHKDAIAYHCLISAMAASNEGNLAMAHALAEESVARYREMEMPWFIAQSLVGVADVEISQGNMAAARTHFEEGLALARKMGEKLLTPYGLEGLADVVATEGEPIWAAHMWGAAEVLREDTGLPMQPFFRGNYERAVAEARAQLGEQAFACAWSEGRKMTPEQALAAKEAVISPHSEEAKADLSGT